MTAGVDRVCDWDFGGPPPRRRVRRGDDACVSVFVQIGLGAAHAEDVGARVAPRQRMQGEGARRDRDRGGGSGSFSRALLGVVAGRRDATEQ
eukprot:2540270-Pleurochrysis_carterae.AAC.2